MDIEAGQKPEDKSAERPVPEITEEDVREALIESVDGARELSKSLKEVFVLTEASATLRLR